MWRGEIAWASTEVWRAEEPKVTGGTEPSRKPRPGFKTSEFMLAIAASWPSLIAVYFGDADLGASDGWRYQPRGLQQAYIVSRGLAKLGTREPYAERFDQGLIGPRAQTARRHSRRTSPQTLLARPSGACQTALNIPAGPHRDRHRAADREGNNPPFDLTFGPRLPAAYAKATSLAKEVSDMTRLAKVSDISGSATLHGVTRGPSTASARVCFARPALPQGHRRHAGPIGSGCCRADRRRSATVMVAGSGRTGMRRRTEPRNADRRRVRPAASTTTADPLTRCWASAAASWARSC